MEWLLSFAGAEPSSPCKIDVFSDTMLLSAVVNELERGAFADNNGNDYENFNFR